MYNWKELITQAQNGDRKAMEDIIMAFKPLIVSLSTKGRNAVIENEVPSICYLEIIRRVTNYNSTDFKRFEGYIKKCLENRLYKEASKYRVIQINEPISTDTEDFVEPPVAGFEDDIASRGRFARMISVLTPRQRQIVILLYEYGYNCEEIGKLLDITPQTVKIQRNAALNKIRKQFF